MTITQTVDIPADRRLYIDVPSEVPTGMAHLEVNVIPFDKQEDKPEIKGKNRFTRKELDEMLKDCPITQKLTGILHTDMTLDEIRTERLAKHL
jgi:hypothetical protein